MRRKRAPRLSKGAKTALNLCLILVVSAGIWFFSDCPTLGYEQAFRIEEKSNLLGPSEILGLEEFQHEYSYTNYDYYELILGRSREGYTMFYSTDDKGPFYDRDRSRLIYREKTDPVTVLAVPYGSGVSYHEDSVRIPVVMFHEYPEAKSAKLKLSLSYENGTEIEFEKEYVMQSQRAGDGYFIFELTAQAAEEQVILGFEGYAIDNFVDLSRGYGYASHAEIPVSVTFYDEEGEQTNIEEFVLRSAGAKKHEERGELRN